MLDRIGAFFHFDVQCSRDGKTMIDVVEHPDDLMQLALRLGAAAVLGGLLGLDRELREKPLGLRSNILVAIGACSFGLMTLELVDLFRRDQSLGNVDPSRVVQGIIEGIGFLGTGAIIHSRGHIRGVTTGATVWVVGAIGLACGFGLYLHAAVVTAVALLVLVVLGLIERRFLRGTPEDR
jgi:putative Mg2+ transporter-C (MgtC) family protein